MRVIPTMMTQNGAYCTEFRKEGQETGATYLRRGGSAPKRSGRRSFKGDFVLPSRRPSVGLIMQKEGKGGGGAVDCYKDRVGPRKRDGAGYVSEIQLQRPWSAMYLL